MLDNQFLNGSSESLLKLISIEFKECLLDSPSFRASIHHKISIIEKCFTNLSKNDFTLENLDNWIYCDLLDNEVIRLYHNYIRPKLEIFIKAKIKGFFLLDDNIIQRINTQLSSFKNYIADFIQYQEKLHSLLGTYCVTNYINKPELLKEDSFKLYTFKIKDLNNSLNLVHEIKILKISVNIEILQLLITLIEKMNSDENVYTKGEWIYSETVYKLKQLISTLTIISSSHQKLNKDINVNKNLILKNFKKQYDPASYIDSFDLTNINERVGAPVNLDGSLLDFKSWVLMATKDKNGVEIYSPRFLYVKKNLLGLFQLSLDKSFVTESDKFGLNLINFKLLDYNNEKNHFRKYSFLLEFKDSASSGSDDDSAKENILFSLKFQCITFKGLCKWFNVFNNFKARNSTGSLTEEEQQISKKRFSPLFKEFMLEHDEFLVNRENKDSVSLYKKLEPYAESDLFIDKTLHCFNSIFFPITTSATNLAIIANAFITQGEKQFPNAIAANTWGSEHWPSFYNYRNSKDTNNKLPLMSQLFIKTQVDIDLTFQNVPFKTIFGSVSDEKAVLALNCFTYFTGDKTIKGSDMMFRCSLYVTYKAIYVYVNSYGFVSLFSIPLLDILDIKLIPSKGSSKFEEPLTMVIYDKKQLNMAIKINYVQYYPLQEKYTPIDKINVHFFETISLVAFKEKLLYLIEELNNTHKLSKHDKSKDQNNSKSIFNVKRSLYQDELVKSAFHKIDYKYYQLNIKHNKLIFFQGSKHKATEVINTDLSFERLDEAFISNKYFESTSDVVSDAKHDVNINTIEFKTSLSIKNNWSKIHKLEVPITIDVLALLLLGKKNILLKKLFKAIHKNNTSMLNIQRDFEKEDNRAMTQPGVKNFSENLENSQENDETDIDATDYSWSKKGNLIYRQYDVILREKKVFNSINFDRLTGVTVSTFDTNEIVIVEKLLQYIPGKNFVFKMEFGKFDIPILGSVVTNLYMIVERTPNSSSKSIISFYFDLFPTEDIGNRVLKRIIFEILKNYLYKKHLKTMAFFKQAIVKFYKGLGNKGQFIECLKFSGNILILDSREQEPDSFIPPLYLNRVTLAKLIIQYYILKAVILLFAFVKRLYLITGILITNITLINKTLSVLLIGSVMLNIFLFSNNIFKSYLLSNKVSEFSKILNKNSDKALLQRSITLSDLTELINQFPLDQHDNNGKIWSNFNRFKVKDFEYRSRKEQRGVTRNNLLVELSTLSKIEICDLNTQFETFLNYELDYCINLQKMSEKNTTISDVYTAELGAYCQDIKNLYIDNHYAEVPVNLL